MTRGCAQIAIVRLELVRSIVLGGALAVVVAAPVAAQGNGKGKGHKSTPPSSTALAAPVFIGETVGGGAAAASPLAWIDDASVLAPGTMSVSLSALYWQGADLGEFDFPVMDVSAGLTRRLQVGVTVPHVVVGADALAVPGGVGTSFISAKIGLLNDRKSAVKLAVAPTLEILGEGALQSLAPGEGRVQFGLPVSAELDRGGARLFGSAGYFSPGVWFAGAGVGGQASRRVAVSVAFSRAWITDPEGGDVRDRNEISGGAAMSLTPQVAIFGSLGTTIGTADVNGAGTTVGGGVTLTLAGVLK